MAHAIPNNAPRQKRDQPARNIVCRLRMSTKGEQPVASTASPMPTQWRGRVGNIGRCTSSTVPGCSVAPASHLRGEPIPPPVSEDDTSAEPACVFSLVLSDSRDGEMTLSSLFLHLSVWRSARGRRRRLEISRNRIRGTPTPFPFRAGLTRRSPVALGLEVRRSVIQLSSRVLRSRGCEQKEQ